MALADDRETCRIDGSHLEHLVEISIPNKLAHVVKRRHERITARRPPQLAAVATFASGSQPIAPVRDDEPELTIVEQDTAAPIDVIAEHKQQETPLAQEPLPRPPPTALAIVRSRRDAILGSVIGVVLLVASWLVSASL